MKERREKEHCKSVRDKPCTLYSSYTKKTYTEQNGDNRQAVLRAVREEAGGLTTDSKTVQNARRAEEERVARRERASEDSRVDDGRKCVDASTADSNDVGRLGGSATTVEQIGIVGRNEHAGDEDTKDVENDDTPEHAADGLRDIAARVLCLRRRTTWTNVRVGTGRKRKDKKPTSRRAPYPGKRSLPARGRTTNPGSDRWTCC